MRTRFLVVAAVPMLAAACGSSGSPQVANLSTTTASTTAASAPLVPRNGSFQKFVTCMRQHGIQAEVGQGGKGVSISGGQNGPDPDRAQAACRKWLPGGGPPPLTPAQVAQRAKAMLAFAKCMRRHGMPNFPDPNGQGEFDLSKLRSIKTSPDLHRAGQACQSLESNVKGPRYGFG